MTGDCRINGLRDVINAMKKPRGLRRNLGSTKSMVKSEKSLKKPKNQKAEELETFRQTFPQITHIISAVGRISSLNHFNHTRLFI